MDSGLTHYCEIFRGFWICVFQSLFQWIPVLHLTKMFMMPHRNACFNPYFSGFRSYTVHPRFEKIKGTEFQSLFQWIPVLHKEIPKIPEDYEDSFNPYFSGFRSYTCPSIRWRSKGSTVSILISVDSGLTLLFVVLFINVPLVFQSLFQWIPVLHSLYVCSIWKLPDSFNPYFSGFRSYTFTTTTPMTAAKASFNPYFSGFRSYTSR